MRASRLEVWKRLYLPSIFPSLVTGWITAAGSAWNASIVAEYIFYDGRLMHATGIGATISNAAARKDMPLLAASLTIMIFVVVLLNRTLWARLYHMAQTRFRMG